MSQIQGPRIFHFGAGNNGHVAFGMPPFAAPAGTMNPVDLHNTWTDPLPVQQPLYGYPAVPQHENIRDPIPQNAAGIFTAAPQANPPANFPAWQGAVLTPMQQPLHHDMAVQQPEMGFRSGIPTNAASFFPAAPQGPASTIPAPQPTVTFGVGVRLGQVDPAERARMLAEGQRLKEARKLGRRGARRPAAETGEAGPAEPPARTTRRPGPRRAAEGQWKYPKAWTTHQRLCGEAEECGPACPLKKDWPKVWAAKKAHDIEFDLPDGRKVFTTGLWVWKWHNSDNRKDKRRRVD